MSRFSAEEYMALSPEHRIIIEKLVRLMGGDGFDVETIAEHLDLYEPCGGCVPDGYTENLFENIRDKFYWPAALAKQLAAEILNEESHQFQIVIEPSVEDRSHVVIIYSTSVVFGSEIKAWHYTYTSLQAIAEEVEHIRDLIVVAYGTLRLGADVITVTWQIGDVQSVRPDLSDEQARAVLQAVEEGHDATIGINWNVLELAAARLFGATAKTESDEDNYA